MRKRANRTWDNGFSRPEVEYSTNPFEKVSTIIPATAAGKEREIRKANSQTATMERRKDNTMLEW